MPAVLSFERSRSKNYCIIKILREFGAYCLARNVQVAIRWIPSELNIADEPSRVYDEEESKLLLDLLADDFSSHGPFEKKDSQRQRSGSVSRAGADEAAADSHFAASGRSSSNFEAREASGTEPGPPGVPRTEAELEAIKGLRPTAFCKSNSESASTSSEFKDVQRGGKERVARARKRRKLQAIVDVEMNSSTSLLEHKAVTPQVRLHYQRRLKDLERFVTEQGLPFQTDSEIDETLTRFFNEKYLEGEGSHLGDYTLAAFIDKVPEFGRQGSRRIPRAWRCLKGWRKLCPSRSRLAYPLSVWCGISWRMVARGHLEMAVFNLLQVSSYHRPGALLKLRKLGLVRPTSRITGHWSLVTSLTETDDVSKTGTKDDSILLDSEWLSFIGPVLEQLSRGHKSDKVWSFDYAEYLSVFHSCCQDLRLSLVPHQARHSGPSIDRALGSRSQEEVRKRGGWVSRQSVARYEKSGRLAATWRKLDPDVQLSCTLAEKHIEDIMLGRDYPDITVPGTISAVSMSRTSSRGKAA